MDNFTKSQKKVKDNTEFELYDSPFKKSTEDLLITDNTCLTLFAFMHIEDILSDNTK